MQIFILKYKSIDGAKITEKREHFLKEDEMLKYLEKSGEQIIKFSITKTKIQKLETKSILYFFKHLKRLSAIKIPTVEILYDLATTSIDKKVRIISYFLFMKMQEGSQLSESMSEVKNIFSDSITSFVIYGEKCSNISKGFEKIIEYIERQKAMKSNIANALAYPLVLLVTVLIGFVLLSIKLIPSFRGFLETQGKSLPLQMRIMISISDFLKTYGLPIALSIVIMLLIFTLLIISTKRCKMLFHEFVIKIPFFGRIIAIAEMIKFLSLISALCASGLTVVSAMNEAMKTVKNLKVITDLQFALAKVYEGGAFFSAIGEINYIPKLMVSIIGSGEKSGQFVDAINDVCLIYAEDVKSNIDAFIAILKPTAIIVAALLFMALISTTLLPIYGSIYSVVGDQM